MMMKEICKDLADECQVLDDIVSDLSESDWNRKTPFFGWTVKDEICHLAFFDRFAKLSAIDQNAFNEEMAKLAQEAANLFQYAMEPGRSMTTSDLLQWWRTERKALIEAFESLDPKTRVPWHIPMSVKSSATARLMETWAHGQDIVDTLRVQRPATDRLRHIAYLGVATFGWSYSCRGMEVPGIPVRVELDSPSGNQWTWGPEDAENLVRGPALDFCLVVTQRRNVADTGIVSEGDVARQWMTIAQAFAGPPETGPKPGERI
jgi:uncharacterized protein (TIGR03084 family)